VFGHQSERIEETIDEEEGENDEHRGTTIGTGIAGEDLGRGLDPVIGILVGDLIGETGVGPGPETEAPDEILIVARQPEKKIAKQQEYSQKSTSKQQFLK